MRRDGSFVGRHTIEREKTTRARWEAKKPHRWRITVWTYLGSLAVCRLCGKDEQWLLKEWIMVACFAVEVSRQSHSLHDHN